VQTAACRFVRAIKPDVEVADDQCSYKKEIGISTTTTSGFAMLLAIVSRDGGLGPLGLHSSVVAMHSDA